MYRERSLRSLVEKWLGTTSMELLRVTRFSHSSRRPWRYACVEVRRESGRYAVVFFRHHDGSWCVFPPATNMVPSRRAQLSVSTAVLGLTDEGFNEAM